MAAPTLTQSVATYQFIDRPPVSLGSVDPSGENVALLLRIEKLLTQAAALFNARSYTAAIAQYRAAESLIYTQIDPQWTPSLATKITVMLPRDPALFDTLLSASSQWLNILPVPYPASPVRPPTPPSASLLSAVANLEGAGLTPVGSQAASTTEAIADMHLATIYASQGNVAASNSLLARAKGLDATITSQIAANNGLTQELITPPKPVVTVPPAVTAPPAVAVNAAALPADVSALATVNLAAAAVSYTLPSVMLAQREAGIITGGTGSYAVKPLEWAASGTPDITTIKSLLYTPRTSLALLPDALGNMVGLWEFATGLPHEYFYVIPLALAACYRALGDYAKAESYYLVAASYTYINTAIEGPYVWLQLASLYLDWGNRSYQQGDTATALTIYSKVLAPGSATPPATPMYTLAGLATAANIAKALIPQLPTLAANGVSSVSADDVAIAMALLQIFARLTQINAGLDFWGIYEATVPIWTFKYLQQVAINFAQLAQQTEQQVINFWNQADQANLTATQLQGQAATAQAQAGAALLAVTQAQLQAQAYQDAATLAQTRATDAAADATEYSNLNSQSIFAQSMIPIDSSGDGGPGGLFAPVTWSPNGPVTQASINAAQQSADWSDNTAMGALDEWTAAAYSQIYQVDSMNRTTTEMQQAATQAQAELTAANAQVTVAAANLGVAQLQANTATQALAVFDADNFTPQVWQTMGNYMLDIYERYMAIAMKIAKLMQAAYNFENDESVTFIQDYYPGVMAWVNQPAGLLGADALMADIQSFTADLVLGTRGKKQLVKTSISLAGRYSYLFETQLRKTGSMTFETTLDDFDSEYPGSYAGRIRSVSVNVQGLVPPTGLSGSLTNGGISWYRLPSAIASGTNISKARVQSSETLVISDYNPATDGVLDSTDSDESGIFEGAGVASTWTFSLPPAINDVDFTTLTDVTLTFLYETRFDQRLIPTVLAQLASRPGFYSRERMIPISWYFPDLFYAFQSSGNLTLTLQAADFPANQTAPTITAITLLVSPTAPTPASGITVSLTAPGKAAASGATDANGVITSQSTGAPWAAATGGSALGNWVISITAAANPSLAPKGTLDLSVLNNLTLVLDYTFTPRS